MRSKISKLVFAYGSWVNQLSFGVLTRVKRVEVDYSKWLGPNYKKIREDKCSTIVANHTGFLELPALIAFLGGNCSFTAAEWAKKVPLISTLFGQIGGIYLPRGGTEV